MTKQDNPRFITQENIAEIKTYLGKKILEKEGEIFYSLLSKTLKQGDVYVLGFNPGNSGEKIRTPKEQRTIERWTIEDELDYKIEEREEQYKGTGWSAYNTNLKGLARKFQDNAIVFFKAMGDKYNPEDVFATNVFFEITDNSKDIDLNDFDKYWKVHKYFLDIIQPKVIICIGYGEDRSSFSLLRDAFKIKTENIENYNCPCCNCLKYKYFDVCDSNGNRKYRVFGLLHFSRENSKGNIVFAGKAIRKYLDKHKEK